MLTSLKLNAVQVIKFTGEYNYRFIWGVSRQIVCETWGGNNNYLSKDHARSRFSTKSRKISVLFERLPV